MAARIKTPIGNNVYPSLDDVCTLLSVTSVPDPLGQPILTEYPNMVFCSKLSITRAEFNSAGNQGFSPDMMLIVDSDSYENEKYVEYYEKKYTIYKTFQRNDGFTELYCEVKTGG
jgi:SPP1 family predicted phage head-tail adaptor